MPFDRVIGLLGGRLVANIIESQGEEKYTAFLAVVSKELDASIPHGSLVGSLESWLPTVDDDAKERIRAAALLLYLRG